MTEISEGYIEYAEDFYNINKYDAIFDAEKRMYLKGYLDALQHLGINFTISEDGTLKIIG